jgi:hypothetical protein
MSRRTGLLIPCALICLHAVAPSSVAAQSGAQGGSCFEIIRAAPNGLPSSPILFNKCSGSTHVLTRVSRRKARAGYVWTPIEMGEGDRPPQKPTSTSAGRKCFAFEGREFCQ